MHVVGGTGHITLKTPYSFQTCTQSQEYKRYENSEYITLSNRPASMISCHSPHKNPLMPCYVVSLWIRSVDYVWDKTFLCMYRGVDCPHVCTKAKSRSHPQQWPSAEPFSWHLYCSPIQWKITAKLGTWKVCTDTVYICT